MTRSIIFIDCETTGTDIVADRIIQLASLKINSLEDIGEEKTILINPGILIPKEATECHGITDEQVKDKPNFNRYAKSLFDYFNGCDYAGFNIIQFDVPILAEEFARCGLDWPAKDSVFYDALKVFFEKEKRDLTAALKFYCNQEHTEAHDALQDVKATRSVMLAQMEWYEDLRSIDNHPSFGEWMLKNSFPTNTKNIVRSLINS